MDEPRLTRVELIDLVQRIQNAQDQGDDYSKFLGQVQANVPHPIVNDLLDGDQSPEYIVDVALRWREEWPKLSYGEMIELVRKISRAEVAEADLAIMVEVFVANCVHPGSTDLIFYPDEYFEGNANPSPEEIVAKALAAG